MALTGPSDVVAGVRALMCVEADALEAAPEQAWAVVASSVGWAVVQEDRFVGQWGERQEAIRVVTSAIELWVAEHAPEKVFVHSACLAVEGRAVVLPGPSRAGKSTLAAAMVAAGASYLSDEYAVLDESGQVHPFTRPIRLRVGSASEPGWQVLTAQQQGGAAVVGPLPVALIATLRFEASSRWSVSAVGPATSALSLMENAVAAQRRPEAVLAAVSSAASTARSVRGSRGEANEAAMLIANLLRSAS